MKYLNHWLIKDEELTMSDLNSIIDERIDIKMIDERIKMLTLLKEKYELNQRCTK